MLSGTVSQGDVASAVMRVVIPSSGESRMNADMLGSFYKFWPILLSGALYVVGKMIQRNNPILEAHSANNRPAHDVELESFKLQRLTDELTTCQAKLIALEKQLEAPDIVPEITEVRVEEHECVYVTIHLQVHNRNRVSGGIKRYYAQFRDRNKLDFEMTEVLNPNQRGVLSLLGEFKFCNMRQGYLLFKIEGKKLHDVKSGAVTFFIEDAIGHPASSTKEISL